MHAVGPGLPRIARPTLARGLAAALDRGSVLVVAGAGYGKTMALEQAIEYSERRSLWLSCAALGGDAGRLLLAAVEGLKVAVPGLADVVSERLAAGLEPVDVRVATAAVLAEVEHLLVERLVVVFDDAEALEHEPAALGLVEQFLHLRGVPLSVAIATRCALPLKATKLRAAGGLLEVGPAELSFTASECAQVLRLRHGRAVEEEEVEWALEASEGWPLGVALAGLAGASRPARNQASQAELFSFLAEEVLDRLDPDTRSALIDSSVPATLTTEFADAFGLPPGFLEVAERQGLFLRAHPSGEYSYHPLFRSFLLRRLEETRTDQERASLHARAAESLAGSGRAAEAVEHWLAAQRHRQALDALAGHGSGLVRTSPSKVRDWLSAMPPRLRREPDYQFLDGQLLWGAGEHERALEPLRAAVAGYRAAGHSDREWLARALLADTLIFVGDLTAVLAVADGWDEVAGPIARVGAAAVAWYQVMALRGLGRRADADALRKRLQRDEDLVGLFGVLDEVALAGVEPGAGRGRATLASLRSVASHLERDDPHGRLPYVLGMIVLVLRDLGERGEALAWLDRCERESERAGLGFVARDCKLQRASLLARNGGLAAAELELARAGERQGTGWRGVHQGEAEAHVALLRGDHPAAVLAAQRALDSVAAGPISWRVWATVDLADVLRAARAPDLAVATIDTTLRALDERFPGEFGRLHRARLLASRACLEYDRGDLETCCETLRCCWEQAGAEADQVVRAHWPELRPVLWEALARRTIRPRAVLPALRDAFADGEALIAMIDHPDPDVRRAALLAALEAEHPAVLARLAMLGRDADGQVVAAALAAGERLRHRPPPLRFELFGSFRAKRAGWQLDESVWGRPMAARVIRFLLLQEHGAVPEDELFDAFWADRSVDSARQHLAVAVSRARKVLDLPGAQQSVIESRERTYRLRLTTHDSIDAVEFRKAANEAIAARGSDRTASLERAAALWTGEPLPEDRYASWTFAWRDQLVATYSHLLSALLESYDASGRHHDAISAARRLLEIDPHNEHAHRQLMVSYARTGQTSQALRQYLECRRALVVGVGVEPSEQTSRLQSQILEGMPI